MLHLLRKFKLTKKIALRFLYNSYQLLYEGILDKANNSTMNVKRLHSFVKQIFELRETNRNVRENYQLNLNIPNYN